MTSGTLVTDVKPNRVKPRWRKVLADLWGDKTRTVLVVASIAVGVFAIGMILSALTIMGQDINLSFAASNPANIEIWTDPFHADLLRVIGKVPGADQVEGRYVIPIRTRRGDENWQGVSLIGIDDYAARQLNQVGTVEGHQFPEKNEIFFSDDMINSTGFRVGDRVEIELPDGSIHEMEMIGLVIDQQSAQPDATATALGYVTMDTIRGLGLGTQFNRLLIAVEGDGGDAAMISQVASAVEDKIESHNRAVYNTKEMVSNEHPMIDTLLAMLGVLGALGILVTVLSASLIVNMLNALLAQQLRQIGVMKLIGARSRQILGMYLGLIIAYSLIALVIAIPTGALAGYALSKYTTDMIGAVLQGFRFVVPAIVVQIIVAFAVPLGAGFFPVNKGARTKVRRAFSDYRPGNQGARQGSGGWVSWISRPILLSFRNTFRKKGRLMLTIFTLTIAGAVFIGVFNVRASMNHVMDSLMQHFLGDITITFSQPYNIRKVARDLAAVPGVSGVEGWGGASAEILDAGGNVITGLTLVTPPDDTVLLNPEMIAGRWLNPGEKKAMVISDSIYDFVPDLQPGDALTVEITGGREEPWEVVGIYKFVSLLGDPLAYADFDYVAGKINLPNQASSFRLITEAGEGDAAQTLIQQVDTQLENKNYRVQSIQSGESMRESSAVAVNTLIVFLLTMALLTAFVGSIGLMGTMSINVLERTREIGVMRTIGAVDLAVMNSVILEGLVIGLITWVLAIGCSYPISKVLLNIIGQTMAGSSFALTFTWFGVLVWLGVVVVLSIVASVMPARSAARLTINEVLAYE